MTHYTSRKSHIGLKMFLHGAWMDFQWQADHVLKVAYLDIAHHESEGRKPGCVRGGIATPCIYGYPWVFTARRAVTSYFYSTPSCISRRACFQWQARHVHTAAITIISAFLRAEGAEGLWMRNFGQRRGRRNSHDGLCPSG